MHLFKQALTQYKEQWKISLLIGLFSLLCVTAAPAMPIIGPFFLSFVLLSFQIVIWFWLQNRKWPLKTDFTPKTLMALVIFSLVMTPTSILIGSAHGLLDNPDTFMTSWSISMMLLFVGLYFYFLIAHALLLTHTSSVGIARALDIAAMATMKNYRIFVPLCLTFAILFVISQSIYGIGWVFVLPLLYFSGSFSFQKSAIN